MQLKNDERRYGAVAQSLHWIIAILIFVMFGLGWTMTDLPLGPDKIKTYNLHKSIGVLILALVAIRLAWRLYTPAPPLPAGMAGWERAAARASHGLLYLLLFAQPLIGIAHSGAANFPVVVFDSLTLPALVGPDEGLKKLLEGAHHWVGRVILALVLLHVAAALRHHFFVKDDVLRRMLPGRQGGSS